MTKKEMGALINELMGDLGMIEPFFKLFSIWEEPMEWWIDLEDRRVLVGPQSKRITLAKKPRFEQEARDILRRELAPLNASR